jgi:hypothetical protein
VVREELTLVTKAMLALAVHSTIAFNLGWREEANTNRKAFKLDQEQV